MLISYSWLTSLMDLPGPTPAPEALAKILTGLGLEVEAVHAKGAGLAAMVRRGPITPRPDWPPSPTWSSRRDKLFSVTSALLLGLGVVFATLSMLAIVLTSLNTQA